MQGLYLYQPLVLVVDGNKNGGGQQLHFKQAYKEVRENYMVKAKNPNYNRNPEGKGGFQDHPELKSDGRWSKDTSVSYWLNYFIRLDDKSFRCWKKDNPESKRTVAQSIAFARVRASRTELKETEFVTNRTEGYPTQPVEHSGDATKLSDLSEKELRAKIKEIDKKLKGTTGGKNTSTNAPNAAKSK